MQFHKFPKDILVKIIENGFYQDIYILIFRGNRRCNKEIVKIYTSKENLYKGYIELNKEIYGDDWEKIKTYNLMKYDRQITSDEEMTQDLTNYLNGCSYEGIFTIEDLKDLDSDFKIYKSSF